MYQKIAQSISIVLHPLLMPFFTFLIIFQLNTFIGYSVSPSGVRLLLLLILILTVFLPLSLILLLNRKQLYEAIALPLRHQRTLPFLIVAIFYYVTFEMLKKFYLPDILYSILLGAAFTATLTLFINLKWKISAHTIGIGGLIGSLAAFSKVMMVDLHLIIAICILIAGFIASIRLFLNAHTHPQVYVGFLLGFSVMLFTVLIQS